MASPSASERPAGATDHFARFGLPVGFALDRGALEDAYLELAAAAHPDKAVGAGEGARRAAVAESGALNEAYAVLRDPVRRAAYVVGLWGVDLGSETQAPAMPQAFLLDMIERRERLAELAGDPEGLEAMRVEVAEETARCFARAVAAIDRREIETAARTLVEHRYLARLSSEIDRAMEGGP